MSNKAWATAEERGNSLGMKIVLMILSTFGYAVANMVLYPIVFYFYATGRASRRASLNYLAKVYRRLGRKAAPGFWAGYVHFISFSRSALDRIWFWQSKLNRFEFAAVGLERINDYLDRRIGVLLLGAHMGSFDSLRVLCQDRDVKVNAVMYLDNAQRFNNLLRAVNPNSQLNIINLKDRNIDGVMELKECIERGELVAILADRFHPSSRSRVVSCSFLGEEAPFPANPWVMASVLECPTFFVAGMKCGHRRYESVVQFVDEKITLNRREREVDIAKYVREYAIFLERLCCRYPYQWYNFFDFWRFDEQRNVSDN
ncbi:MAG: hypothetical protein JXX29_16535 [Deltaproteobacteria bacterium]|nr:hypothetical protein [Deltaproteobacteria bacterium]MBN2673292.1 hypothetical protein [Deltaproteobacteria bacterium]